MLPMSQSWMACCRRCRYGILSLYVPALYSFGLYCYAFRFAGLHTLFCFSGADRVADPFDSEVGLLLEKVAIGVSWLPEGLATAIYALAALLLVFLFIKIVLLIIKCISDLVLFWKK